MLGFPKYCLNICQVCTSRRLTIQKNSLFYGHAGPSISAELASLL